MTGESLYAAAAKKYGSDRTFDSLTPWDRGQWDRHAEKLMREIEESVKLLRLHGYTVTEPEN